MPEELDPRYEVFGSLCVFVDSFDRVAKEVAEAEAAGATTGQVDLIVRDSLLVFLHNASDAIERIEAPDEIDTETTDICVAILRHLDRSEFDHVEQDLDLDEGTVWNPEIPYTQRFSLARMYLAAADLVIAKIVRRMRYGSLGSVKPAPIVQRISMNPTREAVLSTIRSTTKPLPTIEAIADEANMPCNAHFRSTCALLSQLGMIRKNKAAGTYEAVD